MNRRRTGLRLSKMTVFLATCAVAAAGLSTAAAAGAATPPAGDPFYSWSGSLQKVAPGTVLRTRTVTIDALGVLPTATATQVLYRTTNQLGQPDATVATIVRPTANLGTPKLLSYQTFYDGIASTCRPSYTLQGGEYSNEDADVDGTVLLGYVAQGYTVVTSDYEGSTDDFGAGREEGYGTLDAIRAAEFVLGLPGNATPVGLIGYSGGSIASMWAAEEQPTYAPALDLIGVAAAGIPADFAHNLNYIDGSSSWAGAIPAVGIGLLRAYHLNPNQYLSAYGQQIAAQTETGCLDPSADPGLTFAQLLKPQYQNYDQVPIFVRMFNDSIMGRAATPREPLLMGVGDSDGTGDGVMIAKDVQELAYEYCGRGDSVQFNIYDGLDHDEAAAPFETQAAAFLNARYAGLSPANGCGSITPGNPLTPLPQPTSSSG